MSTKKSFDKQILWLKQENRLVLIKEKNLQNCNLSKVTKIFFYIHKKHRCKLRKVLSHVNHQNLS